MKTIELVLVGHPDKVCDGIAEVIKKQNPNGRNAIEVVWFNEKIIIGGETDKIWSLSELTTLVTEYLKNIIGLTDEELNTITVQSELNIQSPEINAVVGNSGAGDNGIFFGGWDKVYSPVIFGLKRLCIALNAETLFEMGYRTDGKLIADINEYGKVTRFVLNVASFEGKAKAELLKQKIQALCPINNIEINPKGDWNKCFGFADSGLTGRKLACDTQCGLFGNGGGAWFGKDTSKADYSIPIYLMFRAKEMLQRNGIDNFVLTASTIIGDTKVYVKKITGELVEEVDFAKIMDFAKNTCVDILGGFN